MRALRLVSHREAAESSARGPPKVAIFVAASHPDPDPHPPTPTRRNEPNLRALREVGGVQLLERLARGREPAVAEAARRALATNGIGHWGRSRAGAFVLRDDLGRACPRKQALTR